MLCTVLNYIALRLLGEEAEKDACVKARNWILDHGGALYIPSWGKIWLAVSTTYLISTKFYLFSFKKIFVPPLHFG